MSQNISDEESIRDAVLSVINRKIRIESQNELADLVLEELRIEDPDIHVSPRRIRRIAVSSGIVRLEIEYRDTVRTDLPDICPVCGNGMSPIMNNTLDGDRVEIKRNCTVCPFTVGKNVKVPGRYVFTRTSAKSISQVDERLRKLRKASSLLRGASRLIDDALKGTNFPRRSEYSHKMIEDILTSKEMTGSIPNLEADIRSECHDDPLWTQAFSSPKYPNRNKKA